MESQVAEMQGRQLCPVCHSCGVKSYLQSYQINLEEAVLLCENKKCTYPLNNGITPIVTTYSRQLTELPSCREADIGITVPESQLTLQARAASHMKKLGHRLQHDAKGKCSVEKLKGALGIQIGSPQLKKKFQPYSSRKNETNYTRATSQQNRATSQQSRATSQQNCFSHHSSNTSHSHQFYTGQQNDASTYAGEQNNFDLDNFKNEARSWRKRSGSVGSSDQDSSLNSSNDNLDSNSDKSSGSSVNVRFKPLSFPGLNLANANNLKPEASNGLESFGCENVDIKMDSSLSFHNKTVKCNANSIENVNSAICDETKSSIDPPNGVAESTGAVLNDHYPGFQFSGSQPSRLETCASKTLCSKNEMNISANDILDDSKLSKHSCHMRNINGAIAGADALNIELTKESIYPYPAVFPQWENQDALCWLDVILCLSAHNNTIKTIVYDSSYPKDCLIFKLLLVHHQVRQIVQNQANSRKRAGSSLSNTSKSSRKKKPSPVVTSDTRQCLKEIKNTVENGTHELNSVKESSSETNTRVNQVDLGTNLEMNNVRESIWTRLKAKLRCEKGQHESPVFAFPLFLKQDPRVAELFTLKYSFEYTCTICKHSEQGEFENVLPTFPEVVSNFSIANPAHKKKCPDCGNIADQRRMVYKHIPECMLIHFTDGLPSIPWSELQFGYHGDTYTVTGVIQYLTNPNHFVAWLRNPHSGQWMECDDLAGPVCRYNKPDPEIPSSQIHIVMWERLKPEPNVCDEWERLKLEPKLCDDQSSVSQELQSDVASERPKIHPSSKLIHIHKHDLINSLNESAKACEVGGLVGSNIKNSNPSVTDDSKDNSEVIDGCSNCDDASDTQRVQCACLSKKSSQNPSSNVDPVHLQNPVGKDVAVVKQIVQSTQSIDTGFIRSTNASPGSSVGFVSVDSVHLPEFVTSTPVTSSIQKPIPCKAIYNSEKTERNGSSFPPFTLGASPSRGDSSSCIDKTDHPYNCNMRWSSSNGSERVAIPSTVPMCSKMNGLVTEIKPSTVFCRPVKLDSKITKSSCSDSNSTEVNHKELTLVNKKNEDTINSEAHIDVYEQGKCRDFVYELAQNKATAVKSSTPKKTLTKAESFLANIDLKCSPQKDVNKTTIPPTGVFSKTPGQPMSEIIVETSVSQALETKSVTKFKLPSFLKRKGSSGYMKDAFLTLDGDSRNSNSTNSSTHTSVHSSPITSPALKGNVTNLSSVKQYLLSRATGKTTSGSRFEGLALGSGMNGKAANSPLGGLAGSLLSKNNCSTNNLCRSSGSYSVGGKKTAMFAPFDAFNLKRKLENVNSFNNNENSGKKSKLDKSPADNGSETSSNENMSLKENSRGRINTLRHSNRPTVRQPRIGGKNMALVNKWASQTQGGWNAGSPKTNINTTVLKESPRKPEVKGDSDNILQDLYEALNIPFNSVNDTITTIMSDVDDILGFVDTSDILPGGEMRSGSTHSCQSSPLMGNQPPKIDCWVRIPGRNSV